MDSTKDPKANPKAIVDDPVPLGKEGRAAEGAERGSGRLLVPLLLVQRAAKVGRKATKAEKGARK
eukprot:12880420-Prorocentrum_lima.AAC.1